VRLRTALLISIGSIAATGCFTVGTPFQVPVVNEGHLGRLRQNELLSNAGADAARPSTTTVRGVKLQCYEFDAYKAGAGAMGKGLLGRSAEYCFENGVLVAYVVTSNVSADSTDFDTAKARSIQPGTTYEQVIALLGKPAGAAVSPIASATDGMQLRYSFTGYSGILGKDVLKDARIELDAKRTVISSQADERPR
jgi:hypothetical protein